MALLPRIAGSHMSSGVTGSFGIIFSLFGLPLIGSGLSMLWTPFIEQRRAAQAIYGLTDQRLLRNFADRNRKGASTS